MYKKSLNQARISLIFPPGKIIHGIHQEDVIGADSITTGIYLPQTETEISYSGNQIAGDSILFTDIGTNGTDWRWSFGDGTESSDQNPVHQYASDGTYIVKRMVSNDHGTDSALSEVNISRMVTKIFHGGSLMEGDMIQFTDIGSGGTDWKWSFGDGDSAFTKSAFNVYEYPGEYVVTMTVFNDYGCELTESKIISVAPAVGINENEHFSALKIFPNPTDGILYILMFKNTEKDLVLDILDPTGRMLFNLSIEGTGQITTEIDLSAYAKGLYLFRIWNDQIIYTRNIIIQ